jgi:hypothetical protein
MTKCCFTVWRLYSRQKGIWHPDETRKIGMIACLGTVVKKKGLTVAGTEGVK